MQIYSTGFERLYGTLEDDDVRIPAQPSMLGAMGRAGDSRLTELSSCYVRVDTAIPGRAYKEGCLIKKLLAGR